jgi:cell division protein FtsZ
MLDFNVEEKKKVDLGARIRVMGIGGGGSNAVNSMVDGDLEDVKFIVANTDAQSLNLSPADMKVQIGDKITKGLGAGSNPDIGRRAAEEDIEEIINTISDADIVFLTAGMGGGTGSGATPVIARAAKELGILSVAIVTKPFLFEGKKRLKQAEAAIEELRKEVDTLLVVPNQKLLELADPKISMLDAFAMVNNVLKQAIKGVSEIITKPGHINVDFADVRSIMKGMGMAIMGTGRRKGDDRAKQAALAAISSPLLENVSIEGARGVLINITGDVSLGLHEINDAARIVYENAREDADIILGSVIDPDMGEEVMVTIIATGFEDQDFRDDVKFESFKNYRSYQHDDVRHAAKISNSPEESSDDKNYESKDEPKEASIKAEDVLDASDHEKVDINDLDAPTYLRKKAQEQAKQKNEV